MSGDGQAIGSAGLGGFVLGPENRLVEVAVESVLGGRSAGYMLIVFFGPAAVGKSHLALGLATAWKASFPRRPAVCTTAVDFARQFADAVQTKTVDDFGARYRQTSLLVMEDLDHLADKPAAQQELAYTLDALLDAGNRAVLTCRAAPEQQAAFAPRLRSRLTAGLTVPVAAPGLVARRIILDRFAKAQSLDLPEPVAQTMAEQLATTVPELRGALARLEMLRDLERRPIDLAMVNEYLAERARLLSPTLDQIARATSRHFSLKLAQLRSTNRARAVVAARGVAMYLARTLTSGSLQQIGRYFGDRDHTTVSYSYRKTEQLLQSEPALRQAVIALRNKLENP